MHDIARELAALRAAITSAERNIEAQSARLRRSSGDCAEARYARTVLHVLNRSLPKMYRRRKKLDEELRLQSLAKRRRKKLFPGMTANGVVGVAQLL